MSKVKICGLSTAETMQAALDQGVDYVGLVFYPRSPRNVSMAQAKALAAHARGKAEIVALVVDADDAQLKAIAAELKPNLIQAHGNETPERIAEICALTAIPIIKAIKVETAADVSSANQYAAELILYDAKAPKGLLPGGNGLSFDWTLMQGVAPPYMLSGGLNPTNVASAIQLTHAPIVDVSSGVESAPGVKDVQLIANFIRAAKSA